MFRRKSKFIELNQQLIRLDSIQLIGLECNDDSYVVQIFLNDRTTCHMNFNQKSDAEKFYEELTEIINRLA